MLPKLQQIVQTLSKKGLQKVILIGQLHKNREPKQPLPDFKTQSPVGILSWNAFLKTGDFGQKDIQFTRRSAMHPLWILYSSGTTGRPKSICHQQGGHVLASAVVILLHHDFTDTEVKMQFSTVGSRAH